MKMHSHVRFVLCCVATFAVGCAKRPPVPITTPPKKAPADAKPEPKLSPFKRPDKVRGIYLTAWSAGSRKKMDKVLAMLDRTELNAVVIDVRDAGQNYWKGMNLPLSDQSGATHVAVVNPKKLMDRLLAANVYPIARIACFRDDFVPSKHLDRAVVKTTGGVWKDRAGHTWLDPYNRKNWDYIASIIDFALDQGFPEIQLDYVRFPSEGKSSTQAFPGKKSYGDPKALPQDVVAAFAKAMADRVRARKAIISADIFGIISIGKTDQGIGQELEKIAEPFDLVCPMVYPSHYAKGEYGVKDPSASPYLILTKSLGDYKKRLPDKPIRPWLQDFFGYGVPQIHAQIKAARELGYDEYLLWNARNVYTESAVVDTSGLGPVGKADAPPKPGVQSSPAAPGSEPTPGKAGG